MAQRLSRRAAGASDIETLYAIYMHETVNPYMGFDVCSMDEFDSIFSGLRSSGDLLVFEQANAIIGVCHVLRREHRLRHVAYLGSLAVHPDFSGQGMGRTILNSVLEMLHGEGFKRVELFVASDNSRAIGLFRSLGFRIEGTLRNFFSRGSAQELFDEHVMALLYD